MNENLRKELGIDEWLEIVKEDKNLYSAYIPFAQYMHILEKENHQLKEQVKLYETYLNRFFKVNNKSYDGKVVLEQLKQRDEVIEKIITNWNALEKYIDENKMILNNPNIFQYYLIQKEILNKYKGDNNE